MHSKNSRIALLSTVSVGAACLTASAGDNLILDGGFDTYQPAIPPFVPEVLPIGWGRFSNAFIFNADEAPPETPDFGAKLFSASFGSYSIPFAVLDLPDFFPVDLLPGSDTDGDGLPEVEVVDGLGTRFVEYTHIPGTSASGFNTTVGTVLSEPGANASDSDIAPGDRIRLTFQHRKVSGDLIQPDGAIAQATFSFRTAPFPAPVIESADALVDTNNDPEDEWVEYTLEAVVPEGTTTIEVLLLHFGLFRDFIPLDEDGDGVQDIVIKDINFTGAIEDFEQDGAGGFVGPEGPNPDILDQNGNPAFETFVTIDGSVPGGAAFFDSLFLENLGPAGPTPCNEADLAEPFELLDLADITAFVTAFVAGDPAADIDPDGVFDLNDIVAFVSAFNAGCP